jgi:hypothetical protein
VLNVSSHVATSNFTSCFEPLSSSWATLKRSLSAINQGEITPELQALVNFIIDPSANLPSYPVEEIRWLVIIHQTQRALVDAQPTHAKTVVITEVGWDSSESSLPDFLDRMMGLFEALGEKGVIIPGPIKASCFISSVEKSSECSLSQVIIDAKTNSYGTDIVLRILKHVYGIQGLPAPHVSRLP